MVKVLLLDDDELGNELVVYVFELAGITNYDICTSGEDALQYLENCALKNNFPDIIFVDINMPGMNGFDFVDQYEKFYRKNSSDTRVIMLTNSVLANEKKLAEMRESVSEFWNKPLSLQRLSRLLDLVKNDN